jgi:hypothetical protein
LQFIEIIPAKMNSFSKICYDLAIIWKLNIENSILH